MLLEYKIKEIKMQRHSFPRTTQCLATCVTMNAYMGTHSDRPTQGTAVNFETPWQERAEPDNSTFKRETAASHQKA